MLSSYYTVQSFAAQEIVIKHSRFIASVQRAESEEEAQSFLQHIKKQHVNANHNCAAYMIGAHDEVQKAKDDGEPSGTAGVPMLDVLKKRQLKDTVVVVTRYFGGVKLGAGGLIRAYGTATTEGLNASGIVERRLMQIMHITADYTWLGRLENECHQHDYQIKDIHYGAHVDFEVYVSEANVDTFSAWITNMTKNQAVLHEGAMAYLEKKL